MVLVCDPALGKERERRGERVREGDRESERRRECEGGERDSQTKGSFIYPL